MAYTSPPPMAEPLLKEKPFGGRILQHMKSVTFPPHPSRCGSAPSTFQEKPFGECICQLSTPAMPDYHAPVAADSAAGREGWRSQTEGEIFKGTDGACADPGTQNFPCHGGGAAGGQGHSQFNSINFYVTHRFFVTFFTEESNVPPVPLVPSSFPRRS